MLEDRTSNEDVLSARLMLENHMSDVREHATLSRLLKGPPMSIVAYPWDYGNMVQTPHMQPNSSLAKMLLDDL